MYELVSDVTRMGEWSPENLGGQWLDRANGPVVGARFKGRNRRRRTWSTMCTVTTAEPGRAFAFDVGRAKTHWAYRLEPTDGGTDVTETSPS